MLLALRCLSFFPTPVRARGASYFTERRVSVVRGSPSGVSALVRGSDTYEVTLALRSPAIAASCGCPYAETAFCKHMWAVILACDLEGHLTKAARQSTSIALVLGAEAERALRTSDDDLVLLAVGSAANDT